MEPPVVLATSISLNETAAEVTEGETLQLTATVVPEDATDKTVTWSTSNATVAIVDDTGLVTAVAPGTATITATTNDGSELTTTCVVTVNQLIIPGDANGDNEINATDYVATANYILGDIPEGFDIAAADLDGNGVIDVADLVGVTNMILNAAANNPSPAPRHAPSLASTDANSRLYVEDFDVTPGSIAEVTIALDNQQPYTALQADIYLPDGLSVVGDFTLTDRKGKDHSVGCQAQPDGAVRIFIKSPSNKNMKDNTGALVTFAVVADGDYRANDAIELCNILAVTAQAVGYNLPDYLADGIITAIDNLSQDGKAADGIYYNLLGIPVNHPTPGIYIRNGKKVIVR